VQTKPWHEHYDYNVPTTIRYPRIPSQSFFMLAALGNPRRVAIDFYGTETTFWQLREQMLRLANALRALGVEKGDRVGILLPNCPQFVIAYLATLSVGAIVVNMNPLYTESELQHIVESTKPTALFTFDMALPKIRSLAGEYGIGNVIVTKITDFMDGMGESTAKELELENGWSHFSELIHNTTEKRIPRVPFSPDDPAAIQFTGGTTGFPKGAVLTHANLVAGTLQASMWGNAILGLVPPEVRSVLSVIPYFHVYGCVTAMNWAFFSCARQILVPRFEIDEVMGVIGRFEKISFFPAVPTMISAVLDHPRAEQLDLASRLGVLNSGAAPMPMELIQRINEIGVYFSEGWGMSESAAMGTSNPILGESKTGSVGIPVPDNDVRLVDLDSGKEVVEPGEPGEILLKGPVVMKGYWNDAKATAGQLEDGWLYSGDIGQLDEDGYLYIVDRKKDMIIAGGFNVYPREIDEVLFQNPKVAEAVSVGIPDAYRGETVKAYVVLKPGQTATEEEIVEFCKGKLTAYKVPKLVEFRDALPKSAVGKILRKILREEEMEKQ
jgi:long-chain acyl-CoA synthetase